MQNPEKVQQAVSRLRELAGGAVLPRAAVVLGSGLSGALKGLDADLDLDFSAVAGLPPCSAPSHAGRLLLGRMGAARVWVLNGRLHLYEGAGPQEICLGVRVLAAMGADLVMLCNAAGCLNPEFSGRIMCVTDQLNLTGQSPLSGPNHAPWGPRFPDMSRIYDKELIELARDAAAALDIGLETGVYAGVPGPQMETPAETRMLQVLGADAVGMSLVLEALAARHMGLRVLAFSVLTNTNDPADMAPILEQDVLDRAREAAGDLGRLLAAVLSAAASH